MEIVLGILTSCLVELVKRLSNKFGKTLTEGFIVGGVFILVLIWTVLTRAHIISEETVKFILLVFSVSTTVYFKIIRKIAPFLENINQQ